MLRTGSGKSAVREMSLAVHTSVANPEGVKSPLDSLILPWCIVCHIFMYVVNEISYLINYFMIICHCTSLLFENIMSSFLMPLQRYKDTNVRGHFRLQCSYIQEDTFIVIVVCYK